MDDRYVGVLLALISGLFIGTSFIITKMGLMEAQSKRGGGAGEGYNYLVNFKWWIGMITMVLGELANFAAYTYAPAILVTPLGAVSVFVSAVLASIFLNERLGFDGKVGCVLCVLGSVVIILHAPEDPKVETIDEFLSYAINFLFLSYSLIVSAVSLFFIYKVAPIHGKSNMLIYITICSLVGSISVMACKGFGIALRISFSGSNQFKYFSTYFFGFIVLVCAVTQMNYLNKALELFSTNRVTPVYYVFFSTATIIASVLLFRGFNDTSARDIVSMFCGFLSIFIGVLLVNSQRINDAEEHNRSHGRLHRSTGHMRVRSSSRDVHALEANDSRYGLTDTSGKDIVIDDLSDDMLDDDYNERSRSPRNRARLELDTHNGDYNLADHSFSSGLPSPIGLSTGELHMMKTFDEEVTHHHR